MWFGTGRRAHVGAIEEYLTRRERAGTLSLPGPAPLLARTIVELCALWAAAPARVVEIGCGPRGGFVPALQAQGYAAVGVDPQARDEPGYHRIAFEEYRLAEPVQAVVASTSLHHVADLDEVLDKVRAALVPGGVLVVVEWARERFDEPTARWCFSRLGPAGVEPGWLHKRRDEWAASSLSWEAYLPGTSGGPR